jgi:hypothetical protein
MPFEIKHAFPLLRLHKTSSASSMAMEHEHAQIAANPDAAQSRDCGTGGRRQKEVFSKTAALVPMPPWPTGVCVCCGCACVCICVCHSVCV